MILNKINTPNSSNKGKLLLLLHLRQESKIKLVGVYEIIKNRELLGKVSSTCCELNSFEDRLLTNFCVSKEEFKNIHTLLKPVGNRFSTEETLLY